MKIAVFGASGRTGILIVYQALNQGFTVTAFARKAENVTIRHKNLTVIQGELTDLPKISEAVEGQDAVLCALGMDSNKPSRVLSEGTRRILEAMEECGVKRFICMSSAGILGNDAGFWFGKVIKPLFLRHVFADKLRQVEVIRESRAKWVILRPVGLIAGEGRLPFMIAAGARRAGLKVICVCPMPFPWKKLKKAARELASS